MQNLMTVKEASIWATEYLGKEVTTSNISYLIQYGRIPRSNGSGNLVVDIFHLEKYYKAQYETKADSWKNQLGNDLNWKLSFSQYKESETTKHVHRLHPYKGKFIPQLVEYFLDARTDEFKEEVFFNNEATVLDPFCGSGTTLVQASELGLNAVGIDVSSFNAFISNVKIGYYDINDVRKNAQLISAKLRDFQRNRNNASFEQELLDELKAFNGKFFPSPEFKYKVRQKEIDEKKYGKQKADEFLGVYNNFVAKYAIELNQDRKNTFLDIWFLKGVRSEIDFVFNAVKSIDNHETKKLLALILSRTIRSCRATTHADLGTLKEPINTTYYCKKHGKICKPLFSILSWWERYTQDTIKRVEQFKSLRSNTSQKCILGDSRKINIAEALKEKSIKLSKLAKNKKIDGIFSSPPYVGLIDYHEQHAYAYDLFGFERKDELEIGPLYAGQGLEAKKSYTRGVSDVLNNCKQYLKSDFDVFLVANDKHGLYPKIAELADMKIAKEYKRPVLNRVEKDRSAYSEIIFHLKAK